MSRIWFVLTYLLCTASICRGQVAIGAGGQVDFPLMFNKNVGSYNHSLGAFGPRIAISYVPANASFYPSLSVNMTRIELPLQKVDDWVVNMHFLQLNAIINANIIKKLSKGELHYGLGIGVSYLSGRDVELTGNAETFTFTSNSSFITAVLPVIQPGLEYIFPISSEKPLFVGIGGKLQYIYFFDTGQKYDLTVHRNSQGPLRLLPGLYGQVLNPGVFLSVYYRLGDWQEY